MRKLKVYGFIGHYRKMPAWVASHKRQSREIIATTSMKRAAQIYNDRASRIFNLCETGNEGEIKIAMAKPHTVFWQPLDSVGEHLDEWQEGESEK